MAMSRYGSSRRRNQNRAAMMIVVVSALCMCALMVLFFGMAMKQQQKPPPVIDERQNDVQTEIGIDPSDLTGAAADTEVQTREPEPTEAVTAVPPAVTEPPVETEAPVVTESPVVTEAPAVQTEPPKPVTPDVIPTIYDAALLAEVALPEGTAPDGYADQLVFYGDSTTHGMKAYKVFGSRDTKQVWTPTSGTLALFRAATDLVWDPNSQSEMSIADLCKSVKPKYLIVTLGVNGVSMMDETWFKSDYQNLVNIIRENSPDTKLILQSIYPIARSYAKQSSINNTKIQTANQWIVQIAKANGLPYLNTYSALVGEDGYLPESYQNGDGMHFNEVGFAKVMEYVKTHPLT